MKISINAAILICLFITTGCEKTPENKPYEPKTEEIKVQDHQFYSGGGNRKQTISLRKGMAAFDYSYNHPGTLKISISDTNQTLIGVVINKGREGLDRIIIPADGRYIFEVEASGKWAINIW